MSGWRCNGGYLGPRPAGPSAATASGWWDSRSQFRNQRDNQWPVLGDPYWADVKLLLPMDGSNESTTFTDASSNSVAVTANGNAQISTTRSKFGGSSGLFDGVGDFLTFPSITLSGDFTVEAWVYKTSKDVSGYTMVLSGTGTGANNCQFSFDDGVEASVGLVINQTYVIRNAGTAVTADAWHHLAWTRSGSTARAFVDGVLVGTGTSSAYAIIANISRWPLGGYEMNGNIDDVRVTAGVARYTAAFTPPATAHFIA